MKKSISFCVLGLVVIFFISCSNEAIIEEVQDSSPVLKSSAYNWDHSLIRVTDNFHEGYAYSIHGDVWLQQYLLNYGDNTTCPVVDFTYNGSTKSYWSLTEPGSYRGFNLNCRDFTFNDNFGIIITFYKEEHSLLTEETNILNIHDIYQPDGPVIANLYISPTDYYYLSARWADKPDECLWDIYTGPNYIILVADKIRGKIYYSVGMDADRSWAQHIMSIREAGITKSMVPLLDISPYYHNGDWLLALSLGGMDENNTHVPYVGTSQTYIGEVILFNQRLIRP